MRDRSDQPAFRQVVAHLSTRLKALYIAPRAGDEQASAQAALTYLEDGAFGKQPWGASLS